MWLIDRTWKPREGWSRPALTVEDNQHHHDEAGKPRRHHGGTNTKSLTRVHDPVPEPPPADRITDFAAAMAQGRRPVPFRTRKLSPGTAMVLCPRGHGRVAHRRNHTSPKARGTHVPRAFPVSRAQRRTPDTDTAEPGSISHRAIFIPCTPLQTGRTTTPDYFLPTYMPLLGSFHTLPAYRQ